MNQHDKTADVEQEVKSTLVDKRVLELSVVERDLIRKFGDRRTRAVLAVVTARRSAGTPEFFVAPGIVALYRLSPRDLNWALDDLEGVLTVTDNAVKGRYRRLHLVPAWEERLATAPTKPREGAAFRQRKTVQRKAGRVKTPETTPGTPTILDDPGLQAELIAASKVPET